VEILLLLEKRTLAQPSDEKGRLSSYLLLLGRHSVFTLLQKLKGQRIHRIRMRHLLSSKRI